MYLAFCSFRILRAPSCPIAPLKNALISDAKPIAEKRHTLPRNECLEEEPSIIDLSGTLPTGLILGFRTDDDNLRRSRNPLTKKT